MYKLSLNLLRHIFRLICLECKVVHSEGFNVNNKYLSQTMLYTNNFCIDMIETP